MTGTVILWAATAVALAASLAADRGKTWTALKQASARFVRILPAFLTMLVLFAVAITLVPQETIQRLLGRESGPLGVAVAALVGSVTLMPGFIAFPLSGALLKQGVPYMVLAAFTTTLMMVGILTYPLERRYFGRGVTLARNGISLLIALVIAIVVGLVFGEIGP
jgi:uncharacterized membrane protein YraQ (UPF0718 family)